MSIPDSLKTTALRWPTVEDLPPVGKVGVLERTELEALWPDAPVAAKARVTAPTAAPTFRINDVLASGPLNSPSTHALAIRRNLTAGTPFSGEQADRARRVLGLPVTRSGLETLFKDCLPGAQAIALPVPRTQPNDFGFQVFWVDNAGDQIGRTSLIYRRHEDGALELHRFGTFVHPDHRSRGIASALAALQIEMTSALSSHPRSCLSNRAGGLNGALSWSLAGFDFHDQHGGPSEIITYDPRHVSIPVRSRIESSWSRSSRASFAHSTTKAGSGGKTAKR